MAAPASGPTTRRDHAMYFCERRVALADVVVDEEARAEVVVADERVGAVRAAHPDDLARGLGGHQDRRDGFERARVLGERAVVRDDGHVQPEFERERARVAEAAARDERDADAARPRLRERRAVALAQLAARVEQRAVEIERDEAYPVRGIFGCRSAIFDWERIAEKGEKGKSGRGEKVKRGKGEKGKGRRGRGVTRATLLLVINLMRATLLVIFPFRPFPFSLFPFSPFPLPPCRAGATQALHMARSLAPGRRRRGRLVGVKGGDYPDVAGDFIRRKGIH